MKSTSQNHRVTHSSLKDLQRKIYRMSAVLLIGGGLIWSISAAFTPAHAQGVYRIVGPDGKVTFSDQPPRDPARTTPITPGAPAATTNSTNAGGSGPALPYELRQVASRFPVTLYAQETCGACGVARNFLSSRGVPYVERTVTSEDDIKELTRLFGTSVVPALSIGRQQMTGFAEGEWTQYLDAAGYPKSSQLPSGYRNGQKQALVAATAPVAASQSNQPNTAPGLTPLPAIIAPPPPTPNNPAGISF